MEEIKNREGATAEKVIPPREESATKQLIRCSLSLLQRNATFETKLRVVLRRQTNPMISAENTMHYNGREGR
eukprot:scaffold241679_cov18-Prasinocladus_malaysianus.AAC.1